MSTPLAGKVVVVTGGTGGLGEAVARRFAENGATIVLGFNQSEAKAAQLVEQLPRWTGKEHIALSLPVTNSEALRAGASLVMRTFARVDVLVNCAGTTRFVPHADLDALDDELIDEILRTNVRGSFAAVRAFREALAGHNDGLVVNISSIAAQTAMGSNVMYCASKAAVENMTRSLARALAPGIRVLAVAPGLVQTEFVKGLDPAWRDQQVANTPLARLAQASDVADAVVATATSLKFSTGSSIAVDGGRPLL
jgi:3-oxoacyl-[acyl-carrier protein] reductase